MKRFCIHFLLLVTVPLLLGLTKDAAGELVFTDLPERFLDNVIRTTLPDGSPAYMVKDICYTDDIDLTTDMVISFDKKASECMRDDTRRYAFYSAEYVFSSEKKALGKGCASFFKKEHGVTISTTEGVWLGSCDDLGSFMIELRFNSNDNKSGVLFSRVGYFSGKKKGIEIKLKNGVPVAYLYNMFQGDDGRWRSASLVKGKKGSAGKWYHLSLSFDRLTGKLAKYVDGREEDVVYMTSTGNSSESVFVPSFGHSSVPGEFKCSDLPMAEIGKDYNGLIDEFRISYASHEDIENSKDIAYKKHKKTDSAARVPYNREGVVTSPVNDFSSSGTAVTDFSWDEVIKDDTFIWMEFRISDRSFPEYDTNIKWYRVKNGQKKISSMTGDDGEPLRGRYCQWRAHLVGSPDGDESPILKKVSLRYMVDVPPSIPSGLEIAETGNGFVVLRWRKNMESDLMGYRIYYGTQKGTVDGILAQTGGRLINNSITGGNYITVRIDDSMINECRKADKRDVLLYPTLENSVLYYFSVTAYDSYKPDTVFNHESRLSQPVSGRPYGGSQIK